MTEEKQIVLNKIDTLLHKRRRELIEELPSVHDVDDGIVIRFFTKWDNCEDDDKIKYKKLESENADESVVFFYIPKGSSFEMKQRYYVGCMTCLNGRIDITANGKTKLLESYSKICVDSDEVSGEAYENTYLFITSEKKNWTPKVHDYVNKLAN